MVCINHCGETMSDANGCSSFGCSLQRGHDALWKKRVSDSNGKGDVWGGGVVGWGAGPQKTYGGPLNATATQPRILPSKTKALRHPRVTTFSKGSSYHPTNNTGFFSYAHPLPPQLLLPPLSGGTDNRSFKIRSYPCRPPSRSPNTQADFGFLRWQSVWPAPVLVSEGLEPLATPLRQSSHMQKGPNQRGERSPY